MSTAAKPRSVNFRATVTDLQGRFHRHVVNSRGQDLLEVIQEPERSCRRSSKGRVRRIASVGLVFQHACHTLAGVPWGVHRRLATPGSRDRSLTTEGNRASADLALLGTDSALDSQNSSQYLSIKVHQLKSSAHCPGGVPGAFTAELIERSAQISCSPRVTNFV
jgi:hypothetical protein